MVDNGFSYFSLTVCATVTENEHHPQQRQQVTQWVIPQWYCSKSEQRLKKWCRGLWFMLCRPWVCVAGLIIAQWCWLETVLNVCLSVSQTSQVNISHFNWKKKFNLCPNLPFDALAKYYPWHVNVSLVNPNSERVRTEAAFQVQEVKPDF